MFQLYQFGGASALGYYFPGCTFCSASMSLAIFSIFLRSVIYPSSRYSCSFFQSKEIDFNVKFNKISTLTEVNFFATFSSISESRSFRSSITHATEILGLQIEPLALESALHWHMKKKEEDRLIDAFPGIMTAS